MKKLMILAVIAMCAIGCCKKSNCKCGEECKCGQKDCKCQKECCQKEAAEAAEVPADTAVVEIVEVAE